MKAAIIYSCFCLLAASAAAQQPEPDFAKITVQEASVLMTAANERKCNNAERFDYIKQCLATRRTDLVEMCMRHKLTMDLFSHEMAQWEDVDFRDWVVAVYIRSRDDMFPDDEPSLRSQLPEGVCALREPFASTIKRRCPELEFRGDLLDRKSSRLMVADTIERNLMKAGVMPLKGPGSDHHGMPAPPAATPQPPAAANAPAAPVKVSLPPESQPRDGTEGRALERILIVALAISICGVLWVLTKRRS